MGIDVKVDGAEVFIRHLSSGAICSPCDLEEERWQANAIEALKGIIATGA